MDLNISFLRPFATGCFRAVGRAVKRGSTKGLAECDVLDEQDRLIARATSTLMALAGEQGKGRWSASYFSSCLATTMRWISLVPS